MLKDRPADPAITGRMNERFDSGRWAYTMMPGAKPSAGTPQQPKPLTKQAPAAPPVGRAGRQWVDPPPGSGAPPGWKKQADGPAWMGPSGEFWDGVGPPPWRGGFKPTVSVDGERLWYPHGGGPPTTSPGGGGGYSVSLRDPGTTPVQQSAPAPSASPFVMQNLGPGFSMMAPNTAWGEANGMEWDGKQWVRRDPNRDIQRQMLEMELKRRQEDMAHEAWKRQQERTATEWALSQQMHPQNQGGVPMIQRDRDGDGIDDNGIPLYGDQPKRRRRPVADPGRAQPMLPPDQGTPYGGGDPRSLGFTPPSPGQARLGMQEWWHNPATQQEIEVPSGWAAPQGWKRGRLGESVGIPAEAPPPGDQRLAGVRAWNDPSNPRFSPTQLTAEKRLF